MSAREAQLRQVADQAVRDIVELDEQVAGGEISGADARPLRQRYEALAARALSMLDSEAAPEDGNAPERPARTRGWALAYTLTAAVALVVAVVLLPGAVLDRPAGGFATGNEAVQGPGGAPPLDPSAVVTDEQLEQVVADNPDVVGMRLALADRYVAQDEYGPAMRHYLAALRTEPRNAEALAHLGWLLLQIDQPQEAWESVQQALAIDPALDDAVWFRANIALYGLDDPAGALVTLQELGRRDLSAEVRAQVEQLAATAQQRQAGGTG